MANYQQQYNRLMADLFKKGCGGIVNQIDPNYKNDIHDVVPPNFKDNTASKTRDIDAIPKTQNERATAGQTVARLPFEVTT